MSAIPSHTLLGERGKILVIDDPPTRADLLAQLEALRAENARLRSLLGFDVPRSRPHRTRTGGTP